MFFLLTDCESKTAEGDLFLEQRLRHLILKETVYTWVFLDIVIDKAAQDTVQTRYNETLFNSFFINKILIFKRVNFKFFLAVIGRFDCRYSSESV